MSHTKSYLGLTKITSQPFTDCRLDLDIGKTVKHAIEYVASLGLCAEQGKLTERPSNWDQGHHFDERNTLAFAYQPTDGTCCETITLRQDSGPSVELWDKSASTDARFNSQKAFYGQWKEMKTLLEAPTESDPLAMGSTELTSMLARKLRDRFDPDWNESDDDRTDWDVGMIRLDKTVQANAESLRDHVSELGPFMRATITEAAAAE